MTYRFTTTSVLAAALICISPGVVSAQDQDMAAEMVATRVDSENAVFAEVAPGVQKAALWGEAETGPYGAFTRFEPGYVNVPHTHTNEIRIVVLEGAYVYTPEEGAEIRVEAGQYFSLPGGIVHTSGADEEAGALFYESSPGGFDMVPVEE